LQKDFERLSEQLLIQDRAASYSRWRQELSGGIAQCLNLEQEIHHTISKLCILGFEPLK
jgi:hypothetical protein